MKNCGDCGQRREVKASHQLVSGKILFVCEKCWNRLDYGTYMKEGFDERE